MIKGYVGNVEKTITRVPMLVNGVDKGWEVRNQQGDIIWAADRTMTGICEIPFRGYGLPLTSWQINANMIQQGTPSPTNIILPEEFGDHTINMYDYNRTNGVIDNTYLNKNTGTTSSLATYCLSYPIPVTVGAVYTWIFNESNKQIHSAPTVGFYDANDTLIDVVQHIDETTRFSFTVPADCVYIRASVYKPLKNEAMLALGSDVTSFEPYGYKIAFGCSTLSTIFLTEPLRKIDTAADIISSTNTIVRRIYKAELTGTENVSAGSSTVSLAPPVAMEAYSAIVCSHYVYHNGSTSQAPDNSVYTLAGNGKSLWFKTEYGTDTAAFKAYLAAQYAAGTPVTVWYIMASPTTESITSPIINTVDGSNFFYVDTRLPSDSISITGHIKAKDIILSRMIDFTSDSYNTGHEIIAGHAYSMKCYTQMRRCNLADDGTINAFYGDASYVEDGSNGQVMVYRPKVYYRVRPLILEPRTNAPGYHMGKMIFSVSDEPLPGFKLHPAFINEDGDEVDYIFSSAYNGSLYDTSESVYVPYDARMSLNGAAITADFDADKLCSISGVKPISGLVFNLTIVNSEQLAKNRGYGWHINIVKEVSLTQLMYMIEYGPNIQKLGAEGVTSVTDYGLYNCSALTGSTSGLGNGTGSATSTTVEINGTLTSYTSSGKLSFSYRGIENPFGNIWNWVHGMNLYGDGTNLGGIAYICDDFEFATDKNTGNYKSSGLTTIPAYSYIKTFGYNDPDYDWLLLGSKIGAGSSDDDLIGDYNYPISDLNGYRAILLGGSWNVGSGSGLFYWLMRYISSYQARTFSARLCYVPRKAAV